MSNPFKVGDYVECIQSGDFRSLITVGQVYEIFKVDPEYIHIIDTYGRQSGFAYSRFKLVLPKEETTPEQYVKEFLKRLEYVLDKDNTTLGRIECWQHLQGVIALPSDVTDIKGVDDIYTYVNNSYDQLTSQVAQKRKQELLDKKVKLDVELAEITKELEGL